MRRNWAMGSTTILRSSNLALVVLIALSAVSLTEGQSLGVPHIQSINFNGGQAWTFDNTGAVVSGGDQVVALPGETIAVSMTVTSGASALWSATGWKVSNSANDAFNCVDTLNAPGAGSFTASFNITAPLSPGFYTSAFDAYQNGGSCDPAGQSPVATMTNSILVIVPNPILIKGCGLDVVLVLDVSSSVDSQELRQLRDAAHAFVNTLLPATPSQIGIVLFSSAAAQLVPLTGDAGQLNDAITSINTTGGETNWRDALHLAQDLLEGLNDRDDSLYPDLIVFCTDGLPNIPSSNPLGSAVDQANSAKLSNHSRPIRIIAVGIGLDAVEDGLFNLKAISGLVVSPPTPISTDTDIILQGFGDLSNLLFQSDVDHDGVADDCDNCQFVANNGQEDCDNNGVGDACTIADCPSDDPSCDDCNANDIPDSCDISAGAADCQQDGIPDFCQNTGVVVSHWADAAGLWNVAAKWCPSLVPNNSGGNTYNVTIGAATSVVTLDISPTIAQLTLTNGSMVVVNDASGADVRFLAVRDPINNQGIFRATDRARLLLDAPAINQSGGGRLQAQGGVQGQGEQNDKSILEINGSIVTGGIAETDADGEIHLIGGAKLDSVTVNGVVVPDGQFGQFGGTITNNSVLRIAALSLPTQFAPASSGAVLAGVGSVRLTSQTKAQLGSFDSDFVNAATHMIEGTGLIFGGLTNNGTVQANINGQQLIISAPGDKINNGTMSAVNGGVLRIATNLGGNGELISQGGTIQFRPGVIALADCIDVPPGSISHVEVTSATVNLMDDLYITGGIVNVSGNSTMNVSGPVNICPAASSGAVAELHISQSTLAAGNLVICPGGVLTVASTINVAGSFINGMIDGTAMPPPAHWSWATGSDLVFSGGQVASMQMYSLTGWATLEAASASAGGSGGTNDFGFANIILPAGAHLSLVNYRRNHIPQVSEAVYCRALTLGTGSILNLNGLTLYVSGAAVVIGPYGLGTIVDQPRGVLGDCCGDGLMSDTDMACFVHVLLGYDNDPTHVMAADMNGDSVIDGSDISQFVASVLNP